METQARIPTSESEQQATRLPGGAEIEVRKMDLKDIEGSPKYSHGGDPAMTHFTYALSLLFPEGELFFMDSVRNYRKQITDPELKKQVKAFLGQEALHTKEHVAYNDRLNQWGIPVNWVDPWLKRGLNLVRRSPKKHQLAVTAALEHFTAIMANELLTNEELQNEFHPAHRKLWLWHAIEETEHKAVAFDVYRAMGGGEFVRMFTMLGATAGILAATTFLHVYLMARDGQLFNVRSWLKFTKWLFIKPALFIRLIPAWASYFKIGFHPWQHDNHELIAGWKAEYEGSYALA